MATIFRLCLAVSCAGAAWASPPDPDALYRKYCALSHDAGAANRAPDRATLRQASPEFILRDRIGTGGASISPTGRLQSAVMAGLDAVSVGWLRLKWACGFSGAIAAYAQPTIAGGRVYAGSALRTVYSLDARSGCIRWAIPTSAPVRSAITIAALPRAASRSYYRELARRPATVR